MAEAMPFHESGNLCRTTRNVHVQQPTDIEARIEDSAARGCPALSVAVMGCGQECPRHRAESADFYRFPPFRKERGRMGHPSVVCDLDFADEWVGHPPAASEGSTRIASAGSGQALRWEPLARERLRCLRMTIPGLVCRLPPFRTERGKMGHLFAQR
jgi:hypothetical protein